MAIASAEFDIQSGAGPCQVCAGQNRGCEAAAVHAMRQFHVVPPVQFSLLWV